MLEHANEDCRVALQITEATKKHTNSQYDRKFHPHTFHEGDLVLVYDQTHDVLGHGKFKPLWLGPYIICKVLGKGAYILEGPKGEIFSNP